MTQRFLNAARLDRLVYNSAVDRHVPFSAGVSYRLALAKAWREKADKPTEPFRSSTFLPVPDPQELSKELTLLRKQHPELVGLPFSMLRASIDDACSAVKKHVIACVAAKAEKRDVPRLHCRSARNAMTVTTAAFTLRRVGMGQAQVGPKTRKVTAGALAWRDHRARQKRCREADWAWQRWLNGWDMARIIQGAERRARRHQADRGIAGLLDQARAERAAADGQRTYPRSDSPLAILGENRVEVKIQGLGRFRVRLNRPVPDGAVVREVALTKQPGWSSRIEVRLTMAVPRAEPALDPLATGQALHLAVRHLAPDAPPMAYVEAVRRAGIPVRGDDAGIAHPSCDDTGAVTPRVVRPRSEVAEVLRLQRSLSSKDGCAAAAATVLATATRAAAATAGPQASRRPKRSRRAKKVQDRIRAIQRRQANRSRTRAEQDAARIVRCGQVRLLPVLVATDPQRMVKPLLAKDGPVERRRKRVTTGTQGQDTAVQQQETAAVSTAATVSALPPPSTFVLSARKRRSMRANLHATRIGLKVRRVALLCERTGVIHATPGHEGTTQRCAGCERVVPKGLDVRVHACPHCGLTLPRDHNSALMTLGRALREYRDGPDPGGSVAAARAERSKRDRAVQTMRDRRSGKSKRDKAAASLHAQNDCAQGGQTSRQGVVVPELCCKAERNISSIQTETLPSFPIGYVRLAAAQLVSGS